MTNFSLLTFRQFDRLTNLWYEGEKRTIIADERSLHSYPNTFLTILDSARCLPLSSPI
ncbi:MULTISPECIES: hypothetical protein [Okeania]|uniref:hypothetical protein n=1 Tax=Okeania TaxID=1458928 RepID=UPI0013750982|nr:MULTISPECIES: hypothetical protein [Okeania]NET13010.1 hypothetical protein [Okeania sp. SIO1H6]NET23453.1 hypothetical protein [Okeania sp. SIO1H5]NET79585.1 hypothetical protein [Okeania sp. SIO1F9]NET96248.1 hypothetical protein [Okeania sp. SIO1H2]